MLKEALLEEVKLAAGCTEIAAIAYAVAKAKEMSDEPYEVKLYLDLDVFKNAASVGVPGDGFGLVDGIRKALSSKPDGLKTLLSSANKYEGKIKLDIQPLDVPFLFIYAIVNESAAIIANRHDELIYYGPKVELEKALEMSKAKGKNSIISEIYDKDSGKVKVPYRAVYDAAEELSEDDDVKKLIDEALRYNSKLAEENLGSNRYFGIARSLPENSLLDRMIKYAAAAVEARMSGSLTPAMSVAGSGNQGIIATLPLLVFSKEKGIEEKAMNRAVVLAWLTTIYATAFTRYVSAVCGAGIKAGNGLAAGLGYLMGKTYEVVESAIINNISSVSGMICDGAKPACSLKAATGISSAYTSALLASKGIRVRHIEGISGKTVEDALANLGEYVDKATSSLNLTISNIIKKKLTEA